MTKPSIEQMEAFQAAFDHFNQHLFAGTLPQVILNFSRSGAKTIAFYAPKRWENSKNGLEPVLDEISLSPKFLGRSLEEVFSSLVHEQVHLWQFTYGRRIPRRSYHNREWAEKMVEIGLQPNDGNGKMTGQKVSHQVIPNGPFHLAFQQLPEEHQLPWRVFIEGVHVDPGKTTKSGSRLKYTCTDCGLNVWGKPEIKVTCGECDLPMVFQE